MPPYQPKPISLDSQVILRSDIGLGEAYMDGDYEVYGSFRSDGTKEVRRAARTPRAAAASPRFACPGVARALCPR